MKLVKKRIYQIFIILLLCSLCCSCSNKGTDYTVEIEGFDISGTVVGAAVGGSPDFLYSYDNAEELSEIAPIIVIGEVVDVYYDDTNARPSTIYDFQLSHVLRGDFEINDIISIEEYGGFIRGDVYASVFGESKFDHTLTEEDLIQISPLGTTFFPTLGDQYILFLTESDIVPGAYCTFGTYMGKYIIENGTFVSRHNPDADQIGRDSLYTTEITTTPLTVNDIISSVEETPFDVQLYTSRFGSPSE